MSDTPRINPNFGGSRKSRHLYRFTLIIIHLIDPAWENLNYAA
jgi:hypothetical protein